MGNTSRFEAAEKLGGGVAFYKVSNM